MQELHFGVARCIRTVGKDRDIVTDVPNDILWQGNTAQAIYYGEQGRNSRGAPVVDGGW